MAQTLTNGIVVPTNPDAFANLTTDLATMGNSANVVIPVASQAARDALVKKNGLLVCRLDLAGCPIQRCDGTNWTGAMACVLTAGTSQSFADGTTAQVQFNTVVTDTGGMSNIGANPTRITIVGPGRYEVSGGGGFSTNTATGRVVAWFRKNGTDIGYGGQAVPITNQGAISQFSAKAVVTLDLVNGDYLELNLSQSSGFAQTLGSNPWQTGYLSVVQVG
ncbi:hypothetical protein SPF06_01110 [Sinomonas sp. JGH33]|uniref:Uncharacterized protein n=1 Tax=Sinomonas terricola TaxID=3110330 RepID=A0ABU5T0Y5_9MICC|nr:hypothetical protein [Sinomonas sp. JGH33]MEA5453310.1 hypothetical protein [Sinomonas sp. JGH33]